MFGFGMEWALGGFGFARADLALVLRLCVAVAVTVHVLLRKREVGSAIGWIGLAWITPLIGGVFYFLLGINRVQRRARRLRTGLPRRHRRRSRAQAAAAAAQEDHLSPLSIAAGRITGRPAEPGCAFSMLHNGDEAYPLMLAAIDAAQVSIALSTYILRDDDAGGPFIDRLAAARARGVQVRVLLDGIGSGYFVSPAYRRLRRQGVPVARFMHSLLPWRMPFLNLRSHKKILVVDGRTAFTGGANIGAENLVLTQPRHPVRDTHFAVGGPVVAQLMDAFARDWQFATGEELEGEAWYPTPIAPAGACVARVITSGPDQDIEKIEALAIQAVSCARRSIHVVTPYFLPDERLISALAAAAMRGVAVHVLIPGRSNHRAVDWATRANSLPLLSAGVQLSRSAPPFDHSKLMVVDGVWSLVGSANWDMRSLRLNFELNVEVYDAALAGALIAVFEARKDGRITAVELKGRPVAVRLRDAAVRLMLPYL